MSETATTTTTEIPEEEWECEACGSIVPESQGTDHCVRGATWYDPAEYMFVCNVCDGGEIDPPEPFDGPYRDDPSLDYVYDPFSD